MAIDIAGDDDIGYEDLGAVFRPRGRGRRAPARGWGGRPRLPAAPRAAALVSPDQPGAPSRRIGIYPAAFPLLSFALADGVNVKSVNMNPQTSFKGQRMFVQVIRSGTSAALTAPLITQMLVGMTPVILTPDGVPAEMFQPSAFDTNLLLPPTEPGVLYQLSMRLTAALAGTDTITVIAGITGGAFQ